MDRSHVEGSLTGRLLDKIALCLNDVLSILDSTKSPSQMEVKQRKGAPRIQRASFDEEAQRRASLSLSPSKRKASSSKNGLSSSLTDSSSSKKEGEGEGVAAAIEGKAKEQAKVLWRWREALFSIILALILNITIHGKGDFRRLETNGFALVATTAPGSHWGNWRSLTRCDCKAFHQCYADLSHNETSSPTLRLMHIATCQLATGMDDECQIDHWEIRAGLDRFRFFYPELLLRLQLTADFSPPVRLGCFWVMSCALVEIILFLISTTMIHWQRGKAKGRSTTELVGVEVLTWSVMYGWHELLSYLVHYIYSDAHTLCDGTGLFFRDAMAIYTLIDVGLHIRNGGPIHHAQWISQAETRFQELETKPFWLTVVRDPRMGAFHRYSGLDFKVVEDPIGFATKIVNLTFLAWSYVRPWLVRFGILGAPLEASLPPASSTKED